MARFIRIWSPEIYPSSNSSAFGLGSPRFCSVAICASAFCGTAFLAVFSLNFVLQPALLKDFFTVAPVLDERGALAPGTLAFARDVIDRLAGPHFSERSHADEAIFLFSAVTICVLSLATLVRQRRTARGADARVSLYFLCAAYVLVVPRMRAYSYILLLIPTLYVLRALPRSARLSAGIAVLATLVAFPLGNTLLPFRALNRVLYEYLPLVAALCAWLALRMVLSQSAPVATSQA